MRRLARLVFRAPVAAFVVLGVVVVGAALDHGPAPEATAAVAAPEPASTSTSTSVALPAPAPRATTTSTVTTTTLVVLGDDDPTAIDNRSWTWDELADCESGSWGANKVPNPGTANWTAVRSIYQGGLQFAAGTWDHYADPGFPADAQSATREQQIVVAEKVISRQGPRAWPTCAPRLGLIGPDLPLDDPLPASVPLAQPLP